MLCSSSSAAGRLAPWALGSVVPALGSGFGERCALRYSSSDYCLAVVQNSVLNMGFLSDFSGPEQGEDSRLVIRELPALSLSPGSRGEGCWCDSRGSRSLSLTELPEGRDHVFWSLLVSSVPAMVSAQGRAQWTSNSRTDEPFPWAVADETLGCSSCPCFPCTPTLLVSLDDAVPLKTAHQDPRVSACKLLTSNKTSWTPSQRPPCLTGRF